MKLSDATCKNAKAGDKLRKLADGKGLFLFVSPKGGKWWRSRYYHQGQEKLLSLGTYPEISLAEAREQHQVLRSQVAKGIDPAAARKAEKEAAKGGDTFQDLAEEWLDKEATSLSDGYVQDVRNRLKNHIYPHLGDTNIRDITPPELLAVLRRVEAKGKLDMAGRLLQYCGRVFRFAIVTGRCVDNPASALKGALSRRKVEHHAAVTAPETLGKLLNAIDAYPGQVIVKYALQFLALTFVRSRELREATWGEFDLEGRTWKIPGQRMKMKTDHIVPLCDQALAVLEMARQLSDGNPTGFVFPGTRPRRPLSENTLGAALNSLGYRDRMTAHGFRQAAATLLYESGWSADCVERQLAHLERSRVRAAYDHSQHLPERQRMMAWWGNYLDQLRAGKGKKVVPIRHGVVGGE